MANHAFAGAPWRVRRRLPGGDAARRWTRLAGEPARVASPAVAYDVVIAGGGFGGLYAARRLERRLPRHSARITLVSDVNFLLYTPLLPGAAAGTLEPRHVVVPLREELEWAELELGRVTGRGSGRERGLRAHAGRARRDAPLRPARSWRSARSRACCRCPASPSTRSASRPSPTRSRCATARCSNLEIAESLPDDEARREYLTFVFVGAGYAGVEGIAELQDYVADVIDRYPRCRLVGTRWILVEAQDRIMREIPREPRRGRRARAARAAAWRSAPARRSRAWTSGARRCRPASASRPHLVCWTAGVRTPGVVKQLGLPLGAGRPHRDRRHHARARARTTSGRSATPPPCPIPAKRRQGARRRRPASTRSARAGAWASNVAAALGRAGSRGRSATGRSACSWTWASTRRSPRCSACACAASRPGSPRAPTTWP